METLQHFLEEDMIFNKLIKSEKSENAAIQDFA